jgi:hypothetical protein
MYRPYKEKIEQRSDLRFRQAMVTAVGYEAELYLNILG